MYNTSIAIQILPDIHNDDKKVCQIVDKVIEYIASTGVSYFVAPFETTIEGDYDQLMDILKNCQLIAVQNGAPSLKTYVKIFYAPEKGVMSIEDKTGKYNKNNK